ncbi:MAG: DNA-deoxyinosine glycosylase [Firmicutes bacterium]|nr:DNA-deoxyinosine glycosylase [Bacillota bacterium]MBR6585098.1 DNA-deoxyinosine glycosylase [Bacillota bacterium]
MRDYPFIPLYDENSEILILGSFPSVKSQENKFFYGHPQNRFWPMIAEIFGEVRPQTREEKIALALRNHMAVWDVIESCDIVGSSDSSIKNAVPNDLSEILEKTRISRIIINGRTAEKFYRKYQAKAVDIPAVCLPSTSPANAAWSFERLKEAWSIIIK